MAYLVSSPYGTIIVGQDVMAKLRELPDINDHLKDFVAVGYSWNGQMHYFKGKEPKMAAAGIIEEHKVDKLGRPAGGTTKGKGINIRWQNGPLKAKGKEMEPNGAFVEDVIAAAIGRIEFYQASAFHCIENATALGALKLAAEVLAERTRAREDRGVEGTHEK